MTISDGLVIAAILLAPLLALQVQKKLEEHREDKRRKLNLFKTLMTTRVAPIDPRHVEALNSIDVEFYKNTEIVEIWNLMLDHFNNYPKDPNAPDYTTKLDACVEKSRDLLSDLLLKMGSSLGYVFDKVHLKRDVYYPKGHGEFMAEQDTIRKSLVSILSGKGAIPVVVVNPPKVEDRLSSVIRDGDDK
jgi:hypothetical protein